MPLALLIGAIVLSVGTGLQTVLLPVRVSLEGFSTLAAGIVGSAHNVGFVAGCVLVPILVRRIGHVASFGLLAGIAAAAAIGYPAANATWAWLLLRFTTGLCMAGLSTVVESWVNACSSNSGRGRSLAIYSIAGAMAATAGQLLLSAADPRGSALFWGIALALLLSALPVRLAKIGPAERSMGLSLRRLYAVAPIGLAGCFFLGLGNGAFWQLAPAYAQGRNLSVATIAIFMSVVVIGGAVAQWPLGRLSDRIDRRKVIIGTLVAAVAVDLLMASAQSPAMILTTVALFGACVLPVYWLCVAHAHDLLGRRRCVAATGGLLLVFGLGAIVGPLVASVLMQLLGPGALFVYLGGIHVVFVAFAASRLGPTRPSARRESTRFAHQG